MILKILPLFSLCSIGCLFSEESASSKQGVAGATKSISSSRIFSQSSSSIFTEILSSKETPLSSSSVIKNDIVQSFLKASSSSRITYEVPVLRPIAETGDLGILVDCPKRSLVVAIGEENQSKKEIKCHLSLKEGKSSVRYRVVRNVKEADGLWDSSFCSFSGCYNPKVDSSSIEILTAKNEKGSDLKVYASNAGGRHLDIEFNLVSIDDPKIKVQIPLLYLYK